MILSTFKTLEPYRPFFFAGFLVANGAFMAAISKGVIEKEIVPGAFMPDMASSGYSPSDALEWYSALEPSERAAALSLAILDLLFIIPTYVPMLGSQLTAAGCPDILCYAPVWALSFDIIETVTHALAFISLYTGHAWRPTPFHLVIASVATQFKFATLTLSLILVGCYTIKANVVGSKSKQE